jgi:hypothetical protein
MPAEASKLTNSAWAVATAQATTVPVMITEQVLLSCFKIWVYTLLVLLHYLLVEASSKTMHCSQ